MKNFHQQPFDEATLTKLDLFRRYIREWLPVFLYSKGSSSKIRIIDFFAGPGRDTNGNAGSPLIALEEIRKYRKDILRTSSKVHLELNEKAKEKADHLREVLASEDIQRDLCSWNVENHDFEQAFSNLLPQIKRDPSLLLLDQQGVKFISDKIFRTLIKLEKTDFIFFTASSTWRRFETHPSLRKYFSLSRGAVTTKVFNDTHRAVTDYYKDLVAKSAKKFFLGSFSIKKGSNIYGLIFGSSHPLGIEKFLKLCWEKDPLRGEANFDIDEENINNETPSLFPELDVPKKLQIFQSQLEKQILSNRLTTDGKIFIACLEAGFLPAHGRDVVKKLIKMGRIRCSGHPRISQDGYKEPRDLQIIP